MSIMKTARFLVIMTLILATLCMPLAQGAAERTATIVRLKGIVEVKTAEEGWMPARRGMVLREGDAIRTKADSSTVISLDGRDQTALVEVREESHLALAKMLGDPKEGSQDTLFDLGIGDILIKAKKFDTEKSKFEVKTPISFVAVRGTIFSVSVRIAER